MQKVRRLISIKEVTLKTTLSSSQVDRLEFHEDGPKCPQRIHLSHDKNRRPTKKVWVESEWDDWIAEQIDRSRT